MGLAVMLTRVIRHDMEDIWAAWSVWRKETSEEAELVGVEDEDEDVGEDMSEEEPPPNRPAEAVLARRRSRAKGNVKDRIA
jgi:hypothetical protein